MASSSRAAFSKPRGHPVAMAVSRAMRGCGPARSERTKPNRLCRTPNTVFWNGLVLDKTTEWYASTALRPFEAAAASDMSGWKLTRPATPPKTTGGRRGSRIGCSWRSSSLALSITRRNHESSVSRRQPKRQCGLPYRRLSCSARLTVMLISDLHIADSHYLWTLFGPYARDRKGPQ